VALALIPVLIAVSYLESFESILSSTQRSHFFGEKHPEASQSLSL
jgi:hypothetical protein